MAARAQVNKDTAEQLLATAEKIYNSSSARIQARDAYLKVLEYDPENLRANFMAGTLFLNHINKEKSTQYFLKVYFLNPEYNFGLLYLIGRSYQFAMDFGNAIKYFNLYLDKLRIRPEYSGAGLVGPDETHKRIRESERGMELVSHPLNYNITNIGSAINSEWPDYGPSTNGDETMLIFTTRRKIENTNEKAADDDFPYEDIFISNKINDSWDLAHNLGPGINRPYNESSLALSKDGKQLYLYVDEYAGDIYVSKRAGNGSWGKPAALEGSINTRFKESSVTISSDGSLIYFASDRPGTLGGMDIFYSIKDRRGVWQDIKNIGPVINTQENEDFPFIDYDGKTLYFSSEGHNGMGGYDIYKTIYDSAKENWVSPLNIGFPINTPGNDISFISARDGRRGYFSSVREGGFGYEDIYIFTIPAEIIRMEDPVKKNRVAATQVRLIIQTRDEEGRPIETRLQIKNKSGEDTGTITRNSPGMYSMTFNYSSPLECTVSAEREEYLTENQNVIIPASGPIVKVVEVTLTLKKLKPGSTMTLRNIYFDINKAALRPESYASLNDVVRVLENDTRISMLIAGHTDNSGPRNYNYRLSCLRAKETAKYLFQKGIDRARIKLIGYGEKQPAVSNDDEEEGRELNRRVEFKLLNKGNDLRN